MFERLRQAIHDHPGPPHLLTTGADGRPHAVATRATWNGDLLVVDIGTRSRANLEACPRVALLWSPTTPGEYSLVVDAEHVGTDAPGGDTAALHVSRAVLHRPATPAGPRNPSCGSDCIPLVG